MNAIAVVDENWGLGKDGKLLAHLPGDLKYFKGKTLGKTIIIGRETFDSMGRTTLPDRETVVLSENPEFNAQCTVCRSREETLDYIKSKPDDELFIAGGEAIYRLFFSRCDKFFITKLYATFDADRYFPNLDRRRDEFEIKEAGAALEENGIRYQFFEYIRK